MAETDEPLLDLATLVERPKIAIDGERYEIASPGELSVLDHQRLGSLGLRMDSLLAKPLLTTAEEAELGQVIGAICKRIMVGVPKRIARKLNDAQRLAVIEVFTELLPTRPAGTAEAVQSGEATNDPIGAKTSPVSSASMAAAHKAGSKEHRSQHSGPVSR